jgi:hypothetical protein
VLDATRDEDERPGRRIPQLPVELDPEGALERVEDLVAVLVGVERRALAGGGHALEGGQRAAAFLAPDLEHQLAADRVAHAVAFAGAEDHAAHRRPD